MSLEFSQPTLAQEEVVKGPPKRKKNILRNIIASGVVAGASFVGGSTLLQKEVNKENSQLDYIFSAQDIALPDKIKMLIATTAYESDGKESLSKVFPSLSSWIRSETKAGMVHIYQGETGSVDNVKHNIQKIRENSKTPVLISVDFEGGAVDHLGFSEEELRAYKVPEEIFQLRHAEKKFYEDKNSANKSDKKADTFDPVKVVKTIVRGGKSSALPSQEWLGREYKKTLDAIVVAKRTGGDVPSFEKRRDHFVHLMKEYGYAMANVFEDVGVNVVFGPNLDIVANIDGDLPDEKDDRSYGSSPGIVSDLAVAYIGGFVKNGRVLPVVKHLGNSFASSDSHLSTAEANGNKQDGSLLPYRDVVNVSTAEERKHNLLERKVRLEKELSEVSLRLESARSVMRPKLKSKSPPLETKKQTVKIKVLEQEIERITQQIVLINVRLNKFQDKDNFNLGIMTSVSASNLYKWKGSATIPTAYNRLIVNKIGEDKKQGGFGHRGVTISDDLSMGSSTNYINALLTESKMNITPQALEIHQALAAGNTIALVKNIAKQEDKITDEVANLIKVKANFSHTRKVLYPGVATGFPESSPELTEAMVDQMVKKVLDLKVALGLLNKVTIEGKEYYALDPRMYNPTMYDVLKNSLLSNQWPWTAKEGIPSKAQPSAAGLLYKATKNFLTSFARVSISMLPPNEHTRQKDYLEAEKNPQKLIIVDKSVQRMYIYDSETRKMESEYTIGIGKGGLGQRRYVGDHITPTGVYRLVQKRNDSWWKKDKGEPLPPEYGGREGGMLVLAGQWHPEIAIHGTSEEKLGQVSNGCVRVSNTDVKKLLETVPIGSMVIIAN